mgnify:CR=1 FL=1
MAYNGEPKAVFPDIIRFSSLWNTVGSRETSKNKIVNLTKRQEAIILGTVLGDGFIQKTGSKNARLRLEHGEKQKDYLLWKGEQFPKLFNSKPISIKRIHPKTKKEYSYFRWQSHSTPELGKWQKLFYQEGKKHIPANLETLLIDPLALAIWYMDDGFYDQEQKHSFIYLGRVSRSEAEIARSAILINFKIDARVYDKKVKGFALFFSVLETQKLHQLLKNYVVPSMKYKISP